MLSAVADKNPAPLVPKLGSRLGVRQRPWRACFPDVSYRG